VNLILIEPEEISKDGEVTLSDRRAQHLLNVLGVQIGQELRAGIVRGPRAVARVLKLGTSVRLGLTPAAESPDVPWLDLVLALPRPKALPRIIQSAASFGVRRIDIVNAWRVDASYFASPKLTLDALLSEARLGCEQGAQTYLPEIAVHRFFVPYVEQKLTPRLRVERARRLLIAHPHSARGVESVLPLGATPPVTVVVGPDGGFVETELDTFVEAGGDSVHFGHAILRSETAVVAILSQLDLLRRLSVTAETAADGRGGVGGAAERGCQRNG
jgi:16S rRNA (uracil1498-N3)-methyltransferase